MILILVMAHYTDDITFLSYKKIWDKIIKIIKYKKLPIDVYYLYSKLLNNDNKYIVENNEIISNIENDYWYSLLIKTLNGFDFFYKNDKYKFVLKTNLSTFLNIDVFYDFFTNNKIIDTEYLYTGTIGNYNGYHFCSGANMILNKNTVKIILDNINKVEYKWTDDIFIGYILNKLNNINPIEEAYERYNIIDNTMDSNLNNTNINLYRCIRVKIRDGNNYFDKYYFELLYNYFYYNYDLIIDMK